MAVRINLLPYRKIRREQRQRQFNLMLAGSLIAAVAVVFLGNNYIGGQIEAQTERNTRLEILLDELARQLPEGVYLKSIRQQGNVITLEGVADTNARVAILVRNFGGSQYLEAPELIEIHSIAVNNLKQSAFTMNVKQKEQKPEGEQK